jgi:hypothetical protein
MARHPKWFETLDAILDEVRANPVEHFGKAEITALFGFKHDRDGFRLLEKFGAQTVANRLSVSRSSLVAQLEAVRSGAAYAAFVHTRTEVVKSLRASQAQRVARQFRVPAPAQAPSKPRLQDLPPTVTWRRTDPTTPGRFEVVYDDGADLLWQLAEFLRVVGANREAYTEATEPSFE